MTTDNGWQMARLLLGGGGRRRPLWALARSPGFQSGVAEADLISSPFRGIGAGGWRTGLPRHTGTSAFRPRAHAVRP